MNLRAVILGLLVLSFAIALMIFRTPSSLTPETQTAMIHDSVSSQNSPPDSGANKPTPSHSVQNTEKGGPASEARETQKTNERNIESPIVEKKRPVNSLTELAVRCGAYGTEAGEPCVLSADLWTLYLRDKSDLPKDNKELRRTVNYLTNDHLKQVPADFDTVRRIVEDIFQADNTARYQFLAYAGIAAGKLDFAKKEYEYLERNFKANEVPAGDLADFYFQSKDYGKALIWEQRLVDFLEQSSSNERSGDMLIFHRNRLEQIRQKLGSAR